MASPPSTLVSRVLVVEDEPMLRAAMVTGLSRLPGVEVRGVGSVGEALAEVSARPPAMVISDLDLPDRSGIELLGELGARGLKPHVVFVSAYVQAYKAQVPPHSGVDLIEKPVSLETLRALVQQRVGSSTDSSPFGVADYLQLASLGHHSVLLEVAGDVDGAIVVVGGEAWAAADDQGDGPGAFRRLVLAKRTMVRCQTLTEDPGPRTLQGSAESLLLECARLADEERRARGHAFDELSLAEDLEGPALLGAEPPPAPAPAPVAAPAPTLGFEGWFERGVEALLAKTYREALEAFRQAAVLKPSDAKVQLNVQRLEALLAAK